MKVTMIFLPLLGVAFFVLFKLPGNFKKWFYKCPIWISSTAIAILMGSHLGGVFGIYAVIILDMCLMPVFYLGKKLYSLKEKKTQRKLAIVC